MARQTKDPVLKRRQLSEAKIFSDALRTLAFRYYLDSFEPDCDEKSRGRITEMIWYTKRMKPNERRVMNELAETVNRLNALERLERENAKPVEE